MIRLTLRGGLSYTGRSITSIVRREYGPRARFWPSRDNTTPEIGVIVSPVGRHDPGTFHVLGDVLDFEVVDQ